MTTINVVLLSTAATIGLVHTIMGPDHYLPFIIMAKARQWKLSKTMFITLLCGAGHVVGSVIIGLLGIGLGIYLAKLEIIESVRGNFAAWLFIGFGFAYFVWGIRQAIKNKPHHHWHQHADGTNHNHKHQHIENHTHVHDIEPKKNLTPWLLFLIFIVGPCEPLIPILMYPAVKLNMLNLVLVVSVFAITTMLTMVTLVAIGSFGINLIKLDRWQRYMHSAAGATLFLSGISIKLLGL